MPLKQDDGVMGKAAVGLAVVAGGIVAVMAYWKWQQNKKATGRAPGEKPASAPGAAKGPVAAAATKPATPAASKPTAAAAPAASKPAPAAAEQQPAASQQSAAAQKEATVQKTNPVAKSVAPPPASVPTVAAPPSKLAAAFPATATAVPPVAAASPSSAAAKPRIPSGTSDNGSDLSMSATFEKVSADPSLTLSSMSSMSASYSGTTTPPAGPGSKPPSMGGPKSVDVHCDSSRESPVFGGQPFSMLDDQEAELTNFDPSKQHPAFFGFKFDGATS